MIPIKDRSGNAIIARNFDQIFLRIAEIESPINSKFVTTVKSIDLHTVTKNIDLYVDKDNISLVVVVKAKNNRRNT
jgi:hypothetical protein